jgi:hypothetical protein
MITRKTLFSSFIILLFAAFIFIGCEQKRDTPEDQNETTTPVDTATQQTPPAADTTTQQQQMPDLTGQWEGQFGEKRMTLTIKAQDGNAFDGETVVRWDPPKREKITGEVNFDTREMTIKETAGTRNNGVYTGTVTADMNKFVGVWKDNGNRLTYNITLNKK